MRNVVGDLRRRQGLSQAQLGQALGVSRQTIISIEKGKFDPSLPLAFKIAQHFDQPLEAIFFPDKGDIGGPA